MNSSVVKKNQKRVYISSQDETLISYSPVGFFRAVENLCSTWMIAYKQRCFLMSDAFKYCIS